MGELTYTVPQTGEKVTVAEPLVDTALTQIKTQVNGKITTANLEAKGVSEEKLATALSEKLSLAETKGRAFKEVTTEQERENTAFGALATPDEVEVTLPEKGLIVIAYQASWKSSGGTGAEAAVFLGANQLKVGPTAAAGGAAKAQSAVVANSVFNLLSTFNAGLISTNSASEYTGEVTTGQAIGLDEEGRGGTCVAFAAAGNYKITVQFKHKEAGKKVTVKNRKLWAWTMGF